MTSGHHSRQQASQTQEGSGHIELRYPDLWLPRAVGWLWHVKLICSLRVPGMAVLQRFWCLLLQSSTAGGRHRSEHYLCAHTRPCPLWALEWPLNITRCSVLNAFIQITTPSSIASPSNYYFTYLPLHLLSRLPISLLPRRRRGFGGKALYMCVCVNYCNAEEPAVV